MILYNLAPNVFSYSLHSQIYHLPPTTQNLRSNSLTSFYSPLFHRLSFQASQLRPDKTLSLIRFFSCSNMMVIINAATALAFLIHATSVISADLAAPILGCDAVGCRSGSNASLFNCSVGGTYSSSIGIAVFKSSVSQDNFTWTEIIDGNASPNFYLGSPVGPSLKEKAASSGFGSCAVFLPLVAPSGPNPKNMTLTCNDTIGKSCVDALVAQAIAVFGSSSSSCDALQSEFQKSLPAECSSSLATNSTTGSTDVIGMPERVPS